MSESSPPRRQRPPRITMEEANAIKRKMEAQLSPDERALLNEAGAKMRFWANVGVGVGFMAFSLPVSMRRGTQFRFMKSVVAGAFGACFVGPLGMMYGMEQAERVILTHPNNKHLLQVLKQTKNLVMAGQQFEKSGSDSDSGMVSDSPSSWPSERQEAFPSTPNETFDDDALLTDDEINKQNQGATFTPPNRRDTSSSSQNTGSAWDELRNKAARQSPPSKQPDEKKENDVWGEDK